MAAVVALHASAQLRLRYSRVFFFSSSFLASPASRSHQGRLAHERAAAAAVQHHHPALLRTP